MPTPHLRARVRSTVLALSAVLAVTLAACGDGGETSGAFASPDDGVFANKVVVGLVGDQSGPVTAYSLPLIAGAQARIRMANDSGGVHGRTIEARAEDTRYTGEGSLRAVKALTDQDPVLALLSTFGEPGVTATNDLIAKEKLPVIGEPTMYDVMFANPYWFTFNAHYADSAQIMWAKAKKDTGKADPRIAFFGFDSSVGKNFVTIMKFLGIQPVAEQYIGVTDTDASTQVRALQSANPDYIFVQGSAATSTVLLKAMGNAGLAVPVIANIAGALPSVWQAAPTSMHDKYFAMATWAPDNIDTGEAKQMIDTAKKYGVAEKVYTQSSFILGWVTASIFIQALQDVGPEPTREKLFATLNTLTFNPGNIGPSVQYTEKVHLVQRVRPYSYDYTAQRMVPIGTFDEWASSITGSYYASKLPK